MKELVIDSPKDLDQVAEELIAALDGRSVVAFCGPMGAGKTTLISAIMEYLGSADTVTSPTFALVNQYYTASQEPVYHFDYYRINSLAEAFEMGYEAYSPIYIRFWSISVKRAVNILPSERRYPLLFK